MTLHHMNIATIWANKKHRALLLVLAAACVLLVIGLSGYLARGWLRNTVIPGYYNRTTAPKVQRVIDDKALTINATFDDLGLHLISVKSAECKLSSAVYLMTSISCSANYAGSAQYDNREQIEETVAASGQTLKSLSWSNANDFDNGEHFPIVHYYDTKIDGVFCSFSMTDRREGTLTAALYCYQGHRLVGDPHGGL